MLYPALGFWKKKSGGKWRKTIAQQIPGSQFAWGLPSPCSKPSHFWTCRTLLFGPFFCCHPDSSTAKHLCPTYGCMENCYTRSAVLGSPRHSVPSTIRLEIPGWTNKGSGWGHILSKNLRIKEIIKLHIRSNNKNAYWIGMCGTALWPCVR